MLALSEMRQAMRLQLMKPSGEAQTQEEARGVPELHVLIFTHQACDISATTELIAEVVPSDVKQNTADSWESLRCTELHLCICLTGMHEAC